MNKERWFANLVILGAAAVCLLAAALALETSRHYQSGLLREGLLVGTPILLGAALLACLRLPVPWRSTLAMVLLSVLVSAYAAETYISLLPVIHLRLAARRFGVRYDGRDQFDVVRDLRQTGVDAQPAVFPAWWGLKRDNDGLLPLGGISNATTVFCNEMGQFIIYESDEHGFRNPAGIWSQRVFDIAVLGDSYTQGACVPSGEGFVDLLRAEHPGTINLGMLGNGPLLMLAGLREFVVRLGPRVVLWIYTEGNDLVSDLERERSFPRLMEYLAPAHAQGLFGRQAEVDTLLREIVEREYAGRLARGEGFELPPRFWRLWALRKALGLQVAEQNPVTKDANVRLFRLILQEAQRTVEEWGGEFYLVYLPAEGRYLDERYRQRVDQVREQVLSIVRDLHLPLVDLHPPISRHPDLAELYAYRGAHFSPAGNRLVAEAILGTLRPASDP